MHTHTHTNYYNLNFTDEGIEFKKLVNLPDTT